MKLYNTSIGVILQKNNKEILLDEPLTNIINRDNLFEWLFNQNEKEIRVNWNEIAVYAPLEKQEVWAAGVTYLRSRDARMEEIGLIRPHRVLISAEIRKTVLNEIRKRDTSVGSRNGKIEVLERSWIIWKRLLDEAEHFSGDGVRRK